MSFSSAIGGTFRTVLIAGATAAAAFGLLVVFQPFGKPQVTAPAANVSDAPAARVLQGRIEALRIALRDTELALDNVKKQPTPPAADATRAQLEAQIAAAAERRDLAIRHAEAIRRGLEAGVTLSSLAGIRDSVVIGQLLSQQAALDAQIAIEGARLKANHPTMRALNAQKASLVLQIKQEAASIASALEAEAKLDDAQIALLQSQTPPGIAEIAPVDTSAIEAKALAQRAELDGLVDAYFNIPPATAASGTSSSDPLSTLNLAVVGVAGLAAILFQILLSGRRRREARLAADEAAWRADHDPESVVIEEPEPLRKAS